MRLRSNKVYNENPACIPVYVRDVEEDEIVYIKDSEFIKGRIVHVRHTVKKSVIRDTIRPFLNNCIRKKLFQNYAKDISHALIFQMLISTGHVVPKWRSKEAIARCVDDSSDEENLPSYTDWSDSNEEQFTFGFIEQRR